ncbi:sulfur carrier protein ThiS [Schlegelella sp. S2-27]|uniref:Sulfur carrier protein ThiS n=1 Tax=Caldimonas mangrovi TaxID=2944811 RepID=A0ABT0YV63_9BURK|nr:sulfur carrier protein ThiS [Caldimonas mangrovi]MCM5681991.1 sulfur carrier protein ThiS [Caldimonas mangrovi]
MNAYTDAYVSPQQPGAVAINVNGAQRHVARGTTLAALLERLGHPPTSVATAVNGNFVGRAARAGCVLQSGDQVSCFEPIVGG